MTEYTPTLNLKPADLLDLLKGIEKRIAQLMPFDRGGVILHDFYSQLLTPCSTPQNERESLDILQINGGFVELVEHSREPILLNDMDDSDVRAQLTAPISFDGEFFGTLLAQSRRANVYTAQHLSILCALAEQAAITLHAARLQKSLMQRQEQLERYNERLLLREEISRITTSGQPLSTMLPQVAQKIAKLIQADACALALWDEKRDRPQRLIAYGIDVNDYLSERRRPADAPSLMRDIVRNGQTYIFNEAQSLHPAPTPLILEFKAHAVLAMPLSARGRPIGAAFLMNLTPDHPFTQVDAEQISPVLDQLALALDNVQLLQDTQARLSETSVLLEIAAVASSRLELNDMLSQVLRLSQKMLGVTAGAVLIYDRHTNSLGPLPGASFGFNDNTLLTRFAADNPYSKIAVVFSSGTGFFTNDLVNTVHESYRELASRSGLPNLLIAPLRVQDEPTGVFIVGGKHGDFARTDLDLTVAMGSHIAAALRNADLLSMMRQRADLMSLINQISQDLTATLDLPALMRKVVRAIHQLLGYEAVHIHLLDEAAALVSTQATAASSPEMLIEEGFSFPVTQGVVGRAIRERKTQLVLDVHRDPDFRWPAATLLPASDLVVLLRNHERILGAVETISFRPDAFQETDLTALEMLATQVSAVLENARLWDQAQRRLLEQGIVHQIGQDLSSILDYTELANAVVRHMTRALDTAMCLLISMDVETQQPRVEAEYRTPEIARWIMPRWLGQPLAPAERTLVERAIETRRPMIFYQGQAVPEAHHSYFESLGITAEMVLPMIAGDRVIGCMLWIETRSVRKFSDSDVRLAQTLTTQAAIAIENARLYRQAQRQAREQALLRRVAVSLSALSDMSALLKQFPREVLQAMAANNVSLALRDGDGIFRVKGHALTTRMPRQMLLGRVRHKLAETWTVLEKGVILQVSSVILAESPAQQELCTVMDDIPGVLALAPIMQRGEVFGLIEISRDDPRSTFDPQELALLEALAGQGAVAIDNISLYEREQRRLRQLEKVQSSSRLLAGQLQMDALMLLIVSEASHIFETPAVNLLMTLPDGQHYVSRATVGLPQQSASERLFPIREDATTHPIYLPDRQTPATNLPDIPDVVDDEQIHSMLSVPINKAGQHLGLLLLYSFDHVRAFSEEEIELAQLFTSQVAVALENARLFDELERRAVELQKVNQLKSEFLARVSHELRTPMNSINGYSELLLRNTYGAVNEKQSDRLERILRNGRNLLALIDDLLDISKIDAGKMDMRIQPVNLFDELNATIYTLEAQATERGLYMRVEASDDLPGVRADSMRLKQVLTNLLGNAIKFTKEGGITVRARVEEDYGRPMILTSVIDTGIGIRHEDQQIIFDEFRQADGSVTREYGGTGLGLAISKKLVELMGGRIWVESEPTQGSTFTFTLPLAVADK